MNKSLLTRKVDIPDRDEDRYLLSLAKGGDMSARNELIMRHMPFILEFVYRYRATHTRCVYMTRDDLAHECVLAMMHAISKYDAAKLHGRFVSYAKWWMRHYLDRAIHFASLYRVPESVLYLYNRGELESPGNRKTKQAVEAFRGMTTTGELAEFVSAEMSPCWHAILAECQQMEQDA